MHTAEHDHDGTTPSRTQVAVDARLCEGHGVCIELSPDIFEMTDEDIAIVTGDVIDDNQGRTAQAAVAACPRQAITMTVRL